MDRQHGTRFDEVTSERSTTMERQHSTRFDEATRLLTGEVSSRRAALQLLGGGALSAALVGVGLGEAVAKKGKGKGKGRGKGKSKGKGTGAGSGAGSGAGTSAGNKAEQFCMGDVCIDPNAPLPDQPPALSAVAGAPPPPSL